MSVTAASARWRSLLWWRIRDLWSWDANDSLTVTAL